MPLAGVFAGFGADAEAHPARVGGTDFHIGDLGGVDQDGTVQFAWGGLSHVPLTRS